MLRPERSPADAAHAQPAEGSAGGFGLHAPALVLVSVGALVSAAAFGAVRMRAEERAQRDFERHTTDIVTSLQLSLERPLAALESVCALFEASERVGRGEFARFVRGSLTRHAGIRALEWIPRVPAAERSAYEAAARADGIRDFALREVGPSGAMVPAAARAEYLPVYYMEPHDATALGFDVGAEPARRAPVDRAAARDAVVASERIRLVEDPPNVFAVAVFCPVWARSDEGRALRGVGAEVLRMRDVLAPVMESANRHGLVLALSDPDAEPSKRLLFESAPGASAELERRGPRRRQMAVKFADRSWRLSFASDPAHAGELPNRPWEVLVAGLALSALAAVVMSALRVIKRLRGQVRAASRLGQYTLVRKIGEGGMGIVWEAQHAMLRRPTAIKLLPLERAGAQAIARFAREVQLTSRLTHPNTVAIYDYGRTAEGIFYYAMEYLDGLDLQRVVELDGAQPAARVVHVLRQVAGALAEAHGVGLVHRDIKPANIVLCERGGLCDVAKVVDFGLVRDAAQPDPSLGSAQVILGTPMYMAPEAIRSPESVDRRTDLYACGAVAYFLLTGKPVFSGSSLVEICSQQLSAEPVAPSSRLGRPIPAALEEIVLRCLAKDPQARFQSAAELDRALAASGVPAWADGDARAFWLRVAGARDAVSATERTVPASPSLLAVVLPHSGNGISEPRGPGEPAR